MPDRDSIQLSTGFTDTVRKASGLIGHPRGHAAPASTDSSGRVIDLHILPSHLTRGDKTWQITARKILSTRHVSSIDRFFVMNDQQELRIDGIASRSREDSVTLRLQNFDLGTFTQIAERMGYEIDGRTNGSASMKSVLQGAEITADILFDSITVNELPRRPCG